MPNYPWLTPHWIVQAEKGERGARPALSQRRWTDKDAIVEDHVLEFDWPEIPRGVGADFEGERALRVFLEITDGPEQRPLAPEAILFARLSGADAVRAGLTKDDEFLVVPVKFFVWVAGALSFDKKVLLSLSQPIMERCLSHEDAEIWPELTWITPMKGADRKYYYAVLSLVGMGGAIDPQKGNPGLYAPIQADRWRHVVWEIVDTVGNVGISSWGAFDPTDPRRDGSVEILTLKLWLVNFLRGLADQFQEEEFERMVRRGEFDRGALAKAISDGLFAHRPDAERIVRENEWLERADAVDLTRAVRAARAFRSYKGASSAIAHGVGEGWALDPQVEANRRVELEWLCARYGVRAEAARHAAVGKDDEASMAELAEKAYLKGDASPAEVFDVDVGHRVPVPGDAVDADDAFYARWLTGFESELAWITGSTYPS